MKRFLWLGLVLFVYVICAGCGDVFRPIIIPNPPVFPNPAAAHTVVSINDNGTVVPGTAMVIDVSSDTDVSIANVGLAPVHAVQQTASQVLVVNHSVTGAVADSITKLSFSGTTIVTSPPPTTITLPANSAPNFVAVAPSATTAYVTLPNYTPPSVGVVTTLSNQLANVITVGSNPDAIAVTPDNSKVYVANQGDSTVNGFTVNNTVGLSSRIINGSFNAPVWVSARSDSQRVYILNGTTGSPQDGAVSTIDTTSTAGPDNVIDASVNVPGAAYMLYDGNLNRLYIPWFSQLATQGQLTILDVSQSVPTVLATVPIPSFTLPNNQNPIPATATAVAALPDGSRAYVASYASITTQLNISSVSGDGTTATYAYTLTAGQTLSPGMTVYVSNMPAQENEFDGTYIVTAIVSGTSACPGTCFQAPNTTTLASTPVSASGTGSNIFPQVTVVWTNSNTIKTTIGIPPFPDATIPYLPNGTPDPLYAPVCAKTRFRFTMAAGGDSSRAYLASCDGGMVNIIDTTSDTYALNLPAPVGTLPPIPPNPQNPPQNPVFLFAGP